MRQLIGARIEFAIAEAALLEHHRDRIGGAGDLGLEQLRQGGRRERMRGVVPLPQNGVALLGRENVEAADRPLRLRNRRLQQANQPIRQRRNARAVEQVGGVFQCPVDPRRLAVRAALLARLRNKSNLALAVSTGSTTATSPGRSRLAGALFCSASITWNSGWRDSERAGLMTSTSRSNGKS